MAPSGAVDLAIPDPTPVPPVVPRPAAPTEEELKATRDAEAKAAKRAADQDRIKEAIDRLALSAEAFWPQIERELDDLAFELDQWPKEYRIQRAGGIDPATGRTTPARPCLQIDKIDQPIQQILNEARMGRLGIEIKPRGNGATLETAQVRQGLIRAIEVDSQAHMIRMWALERAVKCGRGCYRVNKTYANDGDFDLDLVVERVLNQHSVYLDPFARMPDWSDMEWGLITSDIPESEFKRRWPDAELSNASEDKLKSLGDQSPGWITQEKGKRAFRIAEYFEAQYEDRTLVMSPRLTTPVFEDELGEVDRMDLAAQLPKDVQRRTVKKRTIKWCILNALEILDEEVWEGRYIPIIPVFGKEYNVKGVRTWKGVISNAKDAQRSYNVMRSKQLEAIGLSTLAQWVMAEGQQEGHEEEWQQANTRAFPYLLYNPTSYEGNLNPPPHRDVTEPAIAAITQAVREADNDIKSTTGRFDPSLGRMSAERSGRAIRELKVQGETGTSNYLDNLANLSMVYEGKILNDMLEHVYDRPGRVMRILGEEDEEREVMLNQPYRMGPDQQMIPVKPDEIVPPDQLKHYNLKDGGQYRVVVQVGKSYPTMRDEDRAFMSDVAQAWPAGVPIFADLWIGSSNSKAAKQMAERVKKHNPYAKGDDEDAKQPAEIPPEVQQQMQQAQQQVQAAGQQIQQLQQQLEQAVKGQQVKAQAELQATREELAMRERVENRKIEADLMKTRATLAGERGIAMLEAQIDAMAQRRQQRHEREMARESRLLDAMTEPSAGEGERDGLDL